MPRTHTLLIAATLAALAGSAVIAVLAFLLNPAVTPAFCLLLTASGLVGSLFDSLLGATVQAIYFCLKDQKETERHPLHLCGTETVHLRGWKWLTNDWVNFGCGLAGGILVLLIA